LSGLFLPLAFGIGMTMSLRAADIYLRYSWLDTEWWRSLCCYYGVGVVPSRYLQTW